MRYLNRHKIEDRLFRPVANTPVYLHVAGHQPIEITTTDEEGRWSMPTWEEIEQMIQQRDGLTDDQEQP